jgi:uncharacterized protein (UPF0548 family)
MQQLVSSFDGVAVTYGSPGATLSGDRPRGFRHGRYSADLGQGPETFERAVDGLKTWQAHRLPGIRVFPEGQPIEIGATVIVTMGTARLSLAAPCRIVSLRDADASQWGFAYGTLPGHPEQGEEAFTLSMSPDETVRFEITAISRPADAMVRLSGPIERLIQARATRGYLHALQRYVRAQVSQG